MLVDDFIDNFNAHRVKRYFPSDSICVDKSMSCWYGLGGYWINIGLPQYIAIDRKPENGCEIQNCCDGNSGVMMQLKLVKSIKCETTHLDEDDDGLLHGTVVLKKLVRPWANAGDRLVVADSYFSSVGAAEEMEKMGFGFIGVIKTAVRRYPMKYLTERELSGRGDYNTLFMMDEETQKPKMAAMVWSDREQRYFITTQSTTELGKPAI